MKRKALLTCIVLAFIFLGGGIGRYYKALYDAKPEHWHYPRIVHNPYTNLWAVQTGFGRADQDQCPLGAVIVEYGLGPKDEILYYGQIMVHHTIDSHVDRLALEDTRAAPAGHEYKYSDSISAAHFWATYAANASIDSAIAAQKASAFWHERYIEDSIFKLEHNY